MIDSVNWVKGAQAQQKIFVSGIIGWPPGPNDANLPPDLQTNPNYRIDKDATSLPASQGICGTTCPFARSVPEVR